MKFLKLTFAALVLSASAAATASPLLVDFSNYPNTGVHATVSSGGFNFNAALGTIAVAANGSNCVPTCAANGTTALAIGSPNLNPPSTAPITMSTALFGSFRLTGLDFAELSESAATNFSASTIQMVGFLLGGGTVSQILAIDGLNDGPGGANDFQTAVLDAVWGTSELVSLQFSGFIGAAANKAFQLDNIALDVTRTVPEPGTLSLMGLFLIAGWKTRQRSRRNQKVSIS
jgi:hypothetical protein